MPKKERARPGYSTRWYNAHESFIFNKFRLRSKWAGEEDALLVTFSTEQPDTILADRLHRSIRAVQHRRYILKKKGLFHA